MYRLKTAVNRLPFDPGLAGVRNLCGVYEIVCALSDGFPVSGRVLTYPGWWQSKTADTGVVALPEGTPVMTGKVLWFTGYDIGESRIEFFHEPGWGQDGYGTISFGYVDKFAHSFTLHSKS